MARLATLLAAALLWGCAASAPHPEAFAFGVMGDTPYNDAEERHFVAMIERMNREPLAFVVHVGDFKGGGDCSDALYAKRREQFDRSTHPLVYTPGDNEWADCRRPYMGSMDPIERLARLRQVFFSDRWTLGAKRFETEAQDGCLAPAVPECGCAAQPENRAWAHAGVRFVTLNIPGSNNNVGFDAASDREAACRDEANRRWLARAAEAAAAPGTRALVVMIQANPWDTYTRAPVYAKFLAQMREVAQRLARPVLLVHGDTHLYRFDHPFSDALGQPLANPRRLETYGSPFVGWVKVTVDPQAPDLFRAEPHVVGFVPPTR